MAPRALCQPASAPSTAAAGSPSVLRQPARWSALDGGFVLPGDQPPQAAAAKTPRALSQPASVQSGAAAGSSSLLLQPEPRSAVVGGLVLPGDQPPPAAAVMAQRHSAPSVVHESSTLLRPPPSAVPVLSTQAFAAQDHALLHGLNPSGMSGRPVMWVSLASDDEPNEAEDEDEVLAPQTPPATNCSAPTAQPFVGCEVVTDGGWKEVLSRRGPRSPAPTAPAMIPQPIPVWLRGRCWRCLVVGHRAAVCRDPLRCSRCLENGHRARGCRNPWRPLSSLECLAMSSEPRLGIEHRQAPASCEGPMKFALPFEALHRGSWASVVSGIAGSTIPSDVGLQSTLADQSKQLQGLLARVESFLERAEAALGKLSLGSTMLSDASTSCPRDVSDVGSAEDKGTKIVKAALENLPLASAPMVESVVGFVDEASVDLFGSFSPRVGSSPMPVVLSGFEGEASVEAVSPVLRILPELQVLCGKPVSPPLMEQLKLGSPQPSEVDLVPSPPPVEPCKASASLPLDVVERGVSDVATLPSSVTIEQVMPVSDMTIEPVVLAPTPSPDALFAKELCDLLARVEVARPGLGRSIACLLTGTPIRGKPKKVGNGKSGAKDGTGEVNQAGIDHYNKVIDALLAKGIEPYVTLYHWDLPQALEDKYNGLLDRQIINDYAAYAETCFKAFGDRVRRWITFNEPHTVAVQGYDSGIHAPGRCSVLRHLCCKQGSSGTEPYIVAHNIILAHATVSDIYRKKYKAEQNGEVGMSLDVIWYEPVSNSTADIEAAKRAQEFQLGWFADPFFFGDYPATMRSRVRERLPRFMTKEADLVKGSLDFVGINHYTTFYTKEDHSTVIKYLMNDTLADSGSVSLPFRNGKPIGDKANSIWLYIVPGSMRGLMNYVKDRYNTPTVYITENGMDDSNSPFISLKKALKDTKRINYHNDYLTNLADSIREDTCDVRGYFVWSLLDNWEWTAGYTSRFGLFFVDYEDNFKRYPKNSVQWFKNFLASS